MEKHVTGVARCEKGKSVTDYTKGSVDSWDGKLWDQDELLRINPALATADEEDCGCGDGCGCETSEARITKLAWLKLSLKAQAQIGELLNIMEGMQDDSELEVWVQSKITKISDYVNSIHGYIIYYNEPKEEGIIEDSIAKKRWSVKYKKSIDCSNPKGFSQK